MHPVETVLFWLFVIGSIGFFVFTIRRRVGALLAGKPANRFDRPWERIKGVLLYAFVQKRMVRDWYAGFFHLLIFWGFVVLLLRSLALIIEGLVPSFHLTEMLGVFGLGYQATKDVFELLVIVGILMAVGRRLIARPERLENSWDAWTTLSLIGGLMVTDLLADGAFIRYFAPSWASWSPAGQAVASLVSPLPFSAIWPAYRIMWWLHLFLLFGFLNFLPYSKHFHVLTALFNVYFRDLEPNQSLKKMDLEQEHFGANRIQDFTWKQLLDLYTCTECGRCKEVCPTTITKKPLRPMEYCNDLRDYLYETPLAEMAKDKPVPEKRPLIGGKISEDTIWACTTCGYCEYACPLFISYVDKIVEMRRYLSLEEGNIPNELNAAFKGMERNGNPWGLPKTERAKWTEGLDVPLIAEQPDVEYLFWVGCAGAYEDRGQRVSKALVKLLRAAGVSFAILGEDETCTGDSARRLGNEYLFQTLAETNIETLTACGVKKIVTNCPHCFNTLKNEYPSFGGKYEVVHGTQLVAKLIDQGKLKLTQPVNGSLTFHDPCYLGRYNGETTASRRILRNIPGASIAEMERHGETAMCCGAGGGRMWLEEKLGTRINHERFKHVLSTKAKAVAVACPFCNVMLNNAAAETGHEEISTYDVLELAAKALGA